MKSGNLFRWAAVLLTILPLFFYGCGKKGDPRPRSVVSSYRLSAWSVPGFAVGKPFACDRKLISG